MHELLQIIKETPTYVWIIFVYLLYLGITSIKNTLIYLPKLFIMPLVFLVLNYKTPISGDALVFYFVIVLGSVASFFIHEDNKIKIIKNTTSIEIKGNYTTLISLISFFAIKYYFGYLNSTSPDIYAKYAIIENIISGLFSGYFIGRALRYTYKYLKA